MTPIRRRFADLPDRQIHYREMAGSGRPLIALHHLPGSSRQICETIAALAGRHVVAPDLAGTGDSDLHPAATPSIADYAGDVIALLDVLGHDTVDLYGSHTGACLAVEVAILAPRRVRRLVLDGVPLYGAAEAAEQMAQYAPFVEPDLNGAHLLWAHNFCRDQILFWPWYDKSAAAARGTGLPPARILNEWVVEVIKGLDGVPHGYRAVFAYPMAERLAAVAQPALFIAAADDTLAAASRRAVTLLANGRLETIAGTGGAMAPPSRVAQAIAAFLGPD
jgi:pimeloyl-ACP methyl ester carboxylesterase